MKHHKISKLLNDLTISKFVTRKWIEVNDLSISQYFLDKNIRFKNPTLRSVFCDYSDTYIVVKGTINVEGTTPVNKLHKNFKNIFIDNAEDLDVVMPLHNLLEYSGNYSITLGLLWNYYRDAVNDNYNEIVYNHRLNNSKTTTSKSFE